MQAKRLQPETEAISGWLSLIGESRQGREGVDCGRAVLVPRATQSEAVDTGRESARPSEANLLGRSFSFAALYIAFSASRTTPTTLPWWTVEAPHLLFNGAERVWMINQIHKPQARLRALGNRKLPQKLPITSHSIKDATGLVQGGDGLLGWQTRV